MNRRDILVKGAQMGAAFAALSPLTALARAAGSPSSSLKLLAAKANLKLGVQAQKKDLQVATFVQFVTENFSVVTPGNELKWPRTHPAPDRYSFDDADWMVNFCHDHGLLVHGHNLCWNSPYGNPSWFGTTLTRENASHYLTEHITTLMKRYQGRVEAWDVVNEPVVGWSKRPDGLYPGIWLSLLGPEYLEIAFHAAQAADPGALRVLNCYYVEQEVPDVERTRENTVALLQRLLHRGVPVQAVGLESHLSAAVPLGGAGYLKFLKQLRLLGLQILVTELDVDDSQVPGSIQARDSVVAQKYFDYLTETVPAGKVNRVIFWSPSDRGNWLNSMKQPSFTRADGLAHRPGLLDDALQPKLALGSVATALRKMNEAQSH